MMQHSFSPSLLDTSRKNIAALFEAYQLVTGHKPTFVSKVVIGDQSFASRYIKTGMNISTYDLFVGRMSGLWPADHPWPESIPRPAPIPLDDAGAALIAEREAARAEVSQRPVNPIDWPEDIPRPATNP